MITYYFSTKKGSGLETLDQFRAGAWVHVERPNEEELIELAKVFSLEEDLLRDALDPYEVPRIELDNGTTYVYTRVPVRENNSVSTIPILLVITSECVLTITQKKLALWDRFTEEKVEFYTAQKTQFFFQIFSEITRTFNRFVTDIRKNIQRSTETFGTITNREIVQFVRYENALNGFLSALQPTNVALTNLLTGKYITLYEDDKDLVEDIFLLNGQLIESCKTNLRTIVNIRDAYSTIMTNNLNRVIKLLTVLTIVLTIPTMIASFFGMNVPLPGALSVISFPIILGGALLVSAAVLLVFYYKDWLK